MESHKGLHSDGLAQKLDFGGSENTLAYNGAELITAVKRFMWRPVQMLHSKVGFWPYLQTLDKAGKARQGQTL